MGSRPEVPLQPGQDVTNAGARHLVATGARGAGPRRSRNASGTHVRDLRTSDMERRRYRAVRPPVGSLAIPRASPALPRRAQPRLLRSQRRGPCRAEARRLLPPRSARDLRRRPPGPRAAKPTARADPQGWRASRLRSRGRERPTRALAGRPQAAERPLRSTSASRSAGRRQTPRRSRPGRSP